MDFIDAYKLLETELGETTVFDYADTLEKEESNKLHVCRTMRNFIQHNTANFCQPTKKQTEFLLSLVDRLHQSKDTVAKHKIKMKPIKNGALKNFYPMIAKHGYCIVEDKKGLFIVDAQDLVKALNKKTKLKYKKPAYIEDTTLMEKVENGVYLTEGGLLIK